MEGFGQGAGGVGGEFEHATADLVLEEFEAGAGESEVAGHVTWLLAIPHASEDLCQVGSRGEGGFEAELVIMEEAFLFFTDEFLVRGGNVSREAIEDTDEVAVLGWGQDIPFADDQAALGAFVEPADAAFDMEQELVVELGGSVEDWDSAGFEFEEAKECGLDDGLGIVAVGEDRLVEVAPGPVAVNFPSGIGERFGPEGLEGVCGELANAAGPGRRHEKGPL